MVHAGQSEAGRNLAAHSAEVVFSVEQSFDKAQGFYRRLKARARAARPPAGLS